MHSPIFVWMGPTRFFPVRVNTLFLYSDRSIVSTDVLAIFIVAKSRNPHRQLARSWQRMNAKHVRMSRVTVFVTAPVVNSLFVFLAVSCTTIFHIVVVNCSVFQYFIQRPKNNHSLHWISACMQGGPLALATLRFGPRVFPVFWAFLF